MAGENLIIRPIGRRTGPRTGNGPPPTSSMPCLLLLLKHCLQCGANRAATLAPMCEELARLKQQDANAIMKLGIERTRLDNHLAKSVNFIPMKSTTTSMPKISGCAWMERV